MRTTAVCHARGFPLTTAVGLVAVTLTLAATSCGNDVSGVRIDGAWARTSPMAATNGVVYATLTADADDELVRVDVDASVAATVEMHETVTAGDLAGGIGDTTMPMTGSETTTPMSGEMTMRPVEAIALPAGTAVELRPGGLHVMLLDLVAPLTVGESVAVTFVFRDAGEVTIDVPVRDGAP